MPYRKDPELARVRIKEAAVRLFASKGYAATATREIAEEAGVAKPMLYYYFPDKESIYVSIVRDSLSSLAADLTAAVEGSASPVEALRQFVRSYLGFFLSDRDLASVCFQEIFGLGENLLREFTPLYFDAQRVPVERLVRQGPRARDRSDEQVQYIALALLGIPNMFVMRYILHGGTVDVEAVVERAVDYYLAEAGEPDPVSVS